MQFSLSTTKVALALMFTTALSACGTSSQEEKAGSQSVEVEIQKPEFSAFIDGKFTPPDGKTLMVIGQDSDTIEDYLMAVPEDNVEAFTLYSQIKHADPSQTLKGIVSVGNWNSGEVSFDKTLSQTPGAAVAIGLAFDACNQIEFAEHIAAGDYDATIETLANYLKNLAPRKVFLRAGYEFDGLWNCYNPESHKAAFRKIAQGMKLHGADNVAMVWQSAAWPAPQFAGERTHLYDHTDPKHIEKWYPGDDVVDWISISSFYRSLEPFNFETSITPAEAQQLYVDFARAKNKPLFIAEAAPQGYRTEKLTQSPIGKNDPTPVTAEQIWQDWYQPFFEFIYNNRDVIRGVAYINTHWESQPRWYCEEGAAPPASNCPEGNWGDSRVQGNSYIKQKWLEQVNDTQYWVQRADY